MIDFEWVEPHNLESLAETLALDGAHSVLLAGGTDLLDRLKERLIEPRKVVNLKGIEAMRGIRWGEVVDIGALTCIADLAADERLARELPLLAQAAATIATPQLRNMGTLGGNVCQRPRCWYFRDAQHPCLKKGGNHCYARVGVGRSHAILGGGPCWAVHPSDAAPALVVLGAQLVVAGPSGSRQVPIAEFFQLPRQDATRENTLGPGEVVTRIRVPKPPRGSRAAYRKFRTKQSLDFAQSSVAVLLAMEGERVERARLVLGGVAPVPWRVPAAEEALAGQPLSAEAIARAAAACVAEARPLPDSRYKVRLTQGLVQRALEDLAAGTSP
ncbi:MAG: xanthine dehydrogenase family protein subunit M [Candidatus Latescibacterota bacterium]